jgi:hypothetical protein
VKSTQCKQPGCGGAIVDGECQSCHVPVSGDLETVRLSGKTQAITTSVRALLEPDCYSGGTNWLWSLVIEPRSYMPLPKEVLAHSALRRSGKITSAMALGLLVLLTVAAIATPNASAENKILRGWAPLPSPPQLGTPLLRAAACGNGVLPYFAGLALVVSANPDTSVAKAGFEVYCNSNTLLPYETLRTFPQCTISFDSILLDRGSYFEAIAYPIPIFVYSVLYSDGTYRDGYIYPDYEYGYQPIDWIGNNFPYRPSLPSVVRYVAVAYFGGNSKSSFSNFRTNTTGSIKPLGVFLATDTDDPAFCGR